jgi:hypothetical protein
MTRQECEKKLLSLAEQMRAVYMEYNPAGDFLSAIIAEDGYINVGDCYFNAERKIIINADGTMFNTVHVTKYDDGHISYSGPVKEETA